MWLFVCVEITEAKQVTHGDWPNIATPPPMVRALCLIPLHLITRPWSSLVAEDKGCIGPSKELLCLC